MNRIIILLILFLGSCTAHKDRLYLNETSNENLYGISKSFEDYKIQFDDILMINVKSVNERITLLFSKNEINNPQLNQQNPYFNGFVVDSKGEIELPTIGKLFVLNKSINEIKAIIDNKLIEKYFYNKDDFFVNIKIYGFKITALGEFGTQGTQIFQQDRLNIIEAVANLGGINELGDKQDVLVIREYPDGKRIHHVDITKSDVFSSPFFFLKPNDILYAKPLPQKTIGIGANSVQTITTLASLISTVVSIYFLSKNL